MVRNNLQSIAYVAASAGVACVYLLACAGALWRATRR